MLESIPGWPQILGATAMGMAHGMGQKLMGVVLKQIRPAVPLDNAPARQTTAGDDKADAEDLAKLVGGLKSEADWNTLKDGMAQAGIPLDNSATQQLASLRDDVLKQAVSPDRAVSRLAALTAEAFERAGVQPPDLVRWETLAERLSDDGQEDVTEEPSRSAGAIGVAAAKRPATWWMWNRAEVDRRWMQFVKRGVSHCCTACDQGLTEIRVLEALRPLRDLRDQVVLARELLDTMPPLTPDKRAFRIEAWRVKELLTSVEQAVTATEKLLTQTRALLALPPESSAWQNAVKDCRQSVSALIQNLRDRRAVR
jgi:hypothetical protein